MATMRTEPELLQTALDLECRQPRQALRLHGRLRRAQTEFNWTIFLAALAGVVIAASAGFAVTSRLDRNQTAVGVAFLAIGLLPMVALRVRSEARRLRQRLRRGRAAVWLLPLAALVIIADWLKALAVALTGALVLAVVWLLLVGGSQLLTAEPWTLNDVVDLPWFPWLAVAVLVYLSVAYVVDVSSWRSFWLPWHAVPEMLAGLKDQGREVLGFFGSVALGWLLVGVTYFGLLDQGYWLTLAGEVGTAALLGLSAASLEEAEAEPAVLRRLAEIRCGLRLGRVGAARWRLNQLFAFAAGLPGGHYFTQPPRHTSSQPWLGPAMDVLGHGLYELMLQRRPHLFVAMADTWARDRDRPQDWACAPRWMSADWRSTLLDDRWAETVALSMAPHDRQWRTSVANTRDLLSNRLAAHRRNWAPRTAGANSLANRQGLDVETQTGVARFIDAIVPVCVDHVLHSGERHGSPLSAEEIETLTTATRSTLLSTLGPEHR
jgi:hypothetical protein